MSWIIEYKIQNKTTIKKAQYLTDMLNDIRDVMEECEFDDEGVPTNLKFITVTPAAPS